ncbi:MAG: polysaccharide pyruvyl transferase family protein [Armatimonadota bacterium]|nr:MAG: polysaccharide pyruvyl transferase family protein [Armatimonadota bacterium]
MTEHQATDDASSPRRILLATAAGYTNLGDDAIAHAVLTRLGQDLPTVRASVVAGPRFATDRGTQPAARLGWTRLDRLARAVEEADAVVVGGGGLLYDSTFRVSAVDFFRPDASWLIRTAKLAMLARIAQRPLLLYAMGVGPLVSHSARSLARFVAESAQCIAVRDAYSKQTLIDCGVPADSVHVAADPALELPAPSDEEAQAAVRECAHLPRPWIALNLRPWFRFRGIPLAPRSGMDQLRAAVRQAAEALVRETGGSIIGLPLQAGPHGDLPLLRRVLQDIRRRKRAAILALASHRAAQAVISRADVAVGMRLHLHVFAANGAVPSVGLTYDPKVACFLSELGMGAFALSADDVTAHAILEATHRALRERRELQAHLRAEREIMLRRCALPARLLRDMLHGVGAESAPSRAEGVAATWPAERAALMQHLAAMERTSGRHLARSLEPIRWIAEMVRRVTGRG